MEQVLPRLTDLVMSRGELTPIRARVAAELDGEVLEIGFGSGLNVPHYPATITRVRAVDPATVGRTLAAGRVASCPVPWRTGGPRAMSSGGVPAQPTPAPYRSAPYSTNYAPYDNYNHGNGP